MEKKGEYTYEVRHEVKLKLTREGYGYFAICVCCLECYALQLEVLYC